MSNPQEHKTAIFIMPRSSSAWRGAEAVWISTAGWAAAAKRKFGDSMVVCIDRVATSEEAVHFPREKRGAKFLSEKRRNKSFLPSFIMIFLSDIRTWFTHRNWEILKRLSCEGKEVAFVWEKHDLFCGAGKKLALELQVPYISYVHAPVVWEASKWGVKRYIWGTYLERKESESLKKADLVAVVSEEVKQKVMEMGISEKKIMISPMAVDPILFNVEATQIDILRERYKLGSKFVIGWTGSFRSFHGLEQVVEAFHQLSMIYPQMILMLIGDGAEKAAIQRLIGQLKIREKVIFVVRKPFLEIPSYLALFDLAIVSAKKAEGFHYSPLKLREYLASGIAVLAPDAGEIPEIFEDDYHLKLFLAGDVRSLRKGMETLMTDSEKRRRIAAQGKKFVMETGTWDVELEKTLERLKPEEQ